MIVLRQRGWIGVDIGSHTLKLAQVERQGDRLRLAEALVIRRREPWAGDDAELPPMPSTEELRAGLALGGNFSGRRAAAVLSMAACDAHGCAFPDDEHVDASEQVARELESAYGVAAERREYDFWEVRPGGDQSPGAEDVISFSLSQDWSTRVARDLKESRLMGLALDALPLALGRAVELSAPGASQTPIAAIDWGCRRATLCVIQGGRPLFVRFLRECDFASVIEALCKQLSVTSDEAQKLLVEHGLPNRSDRAADELQGVIEEILAEPLDRLLDELNRTLSFLRQQRRSLVPSKIVLFGGGAVVKNITHQLLEKVDLPIELWRLDDGGAGAASQLPSPILGPAIALSALAWSTK